MTTRQKCLVVLNRLSKFGSAAYDPKKGAGIIIQAPLSNIEQFCKLIQELNRNIYENNLIEGRHCVFKTTEMSLDTFFVSDNKTYLPKEIINQFISVATLLCEQTETAEEAEYGALEHNYRMLTGVYTNILSVCSALLEAVQ